MQQVKLGLHRSTQARDERAVQQNQLLAAMTQVQIGRNTDAIAGLGHLLATPAGEFISVSLLKLDPTWDPIRNDPRFQALLEEYGQTEPATAASGGDHG